MKFFQRQEYDTPEEKKLSVMRFWFFVLGIFSFIIPLAVLYVVNMAMGVNWAYIIKPSLIIFFIVCAILIVVYFVYRAILTRAKS